MENIMDTERFRTMQATLTADGFEVEHLGGGLVGLALYLPENAGTFVVTDDVDEVILGFYEGTEWADGGEETEDHFLTGETDDIIAAIREHVTAKAAR